MLVEGRHFLSTVAPERLGHKALAVNLSDLAACGAQPLAFTLALALPRADEAFLDGFARGLFALADAHGMRAGRRRHHAGAAEHLHHRVRRGAGRAGAAALGRARRRRPVRQRHGRRRAAGARGASAARVALPGRRLRRGARRDGAAAAARRARPGAARHGERARSTCPTACSATWATCCAAPASARRCDVDAVPRSAVLRRAAAGAAARMHAGRRRRLRAAVHRAAGARRARCRPRRARPAWRPRASAASKPSRGAAPGRSRQGQRGGRTPSARFDHFRALRPTVNATPPLHPPLARAPRSPSWRFMSAPPGAPDRARLRQRPVAHGRRARSARCGPGWPSCCCSPGLSDAATGRGAARPRLRSSAGGPAPRTARHLAHRRPRRHRLGRGGRLLARAVAGDAGRACWAQVVGLRAVPLLRCRQARPGGLGRRAVQEPARPARSAGRRASASCSTTWWPRCARCS